MHATSPSNRQSAIRNPQSLLLVAVALALLSSCRGEGPKVEPISYGEATCARCRSVINKAPFAAQSRYAGGQVKLFDDPGCLITSLGGEAEAPRHVFFHHHAAEKWIPGAEAWFAKTPQTRSPQKYDWAAFSDFAQAQDAVTSAGGGEILPFEQLKERLAK
jgi:hypothetical protein